MNAAVAKKIPFFIGPCVIENLELLLEIAEHLKKELLSQSSHIDIIFKASFDKANRSARNSFRGPGLEEGLKIFEEFKKITQLAVITDFHLPEQAEEVASVVDYLQIPAFLCRQTDLVRAGASAAKKHGRFLNVKKGQFLAPWDARNIIDKVKEFLPPEELFITERGVSFGYGNLVVDMSSFNILNSMGVRSVFDCTHSVQKPGGGGSTTGGRREAIFPLARAAAAAGAMSFFIETHPRPEKALSDAATVLDLNLLRPLVNELVEIRHLAENLIERASV